MTAGAEPGPTRSAAGDRFGRPIERPDGADFPYYDGQPVLIGGRGWWLVIAGVVVGFGALLALPFDEPILQFIPAVLFTGLPLLALRIVAGSRWTALFSRVTGRDLGLMVLFAVLNIVVTLGAGFLLAATSGATANPAAGQLAGASPLELALFYPRTAIQLVGEELLTILPFLALLYLLTARLGWSRRRAVLLAWVVTAIAFGLVHLPTYNWNVLQCVLVIGLARIVLTLAYLRTKNLWVSAGAHILNDWTLFTIPLITSASA